MDVRAREATSEATCPLCREALGGEPTSCRGCETRYHEACLAELGGCSTLGCSLLGVAVGRARSLGCGVCGALAAEPLTRRRCGCGATLHEACVDAHARACARGRRLQGDGARPATRPAGRRPADPAFAYAVGIQLCVVPYAALSWWDPTMLVVLFLLPLFAGLFQAEVRQAFRERALDPAEGLRAELAAMSLMIPVLGVVLCWWLLPRSRS